MPYLPLSLARSSRVASSGRADRKSRPSLTSLEISERQSDSEVDMKGTYFFPRKSLTDFAASRKFNMPSKSSVYVGGGSIRARQPVHLSKVLYRSDARRLEINDDKL